MQKGGDINEDMDEKFDAMDQISQLPEFIIHHIMSFLYPKDVARTSLLSKRWNNLRASFPILKFDQSEFNKDLSFYDSNDSPKITETRKKFMTFVDDSLRSFSVQRMCMEKLALYMTLDLKLASCVDKWVGLAIENSVKDLIIHLKTNDWCDFSQAQLKEWYHLPETVFATKSISSLDIKGCKLELPSGNLIKFSSLQKLCLDQVYIDEDIIQNFVRSCPLIKYFSLFNSWGFKSFCISKLSYLEIVNLCPVSAEFKELYVEAPRLKAFDFHYCTMNNSCTIDMAASQDLKQLSITYSYITVQLLQKLISKFPNLEELNVGYSNILDRIAISSHKLKSLRLDGSSQLKVAEIDAPNLLVFKYTGFDMPILYSKSALCRWEIRLLVVNFNSNWFLKLREFLDNLNCRKFLNLYISYSEGMFDFEELTEKSLRLPYELEHLTLEVRRWSSISSSMSSALLDGLFWCCHPKIISVESGSDCSNAFIKLLGEKLMNVEVRSCCTSSQIKCWLHYLEDVDIESFERKSDERFYDWNTLLDALPTLAKGTKLCFRFNWRSY